MRKAAGKMLGHGRMKLWIVLSAAVVGFVLTPVVAGEGGGKRPPGPRRDREGDVHRGRAGVRRPLGGPRGGRGPGSEQRGDWPGEFGEPGGAEVSEAEIEEFLLMLSETLPKRYEKLAGIREKRPEAFRMMMRHRGPMLRHVLGAKRKSPKLAGLMLREHFIEEQLRDLERRHRDVRKSQKLEIEKEVQSILKDLFDVKMERQGMEIAHLEERLTSHKGMLEARKKNKDEILQREFDRRFRPELSLE